MSRSGQPSSSASANFRPSPAAPSYVDHVEARLRALVQAVGHLECLGRPPSRGGHQVHVEGGDRARPGDALLVGVLLDRRGNDAGRADSVGAHHDVLLCALPVEVGGG